MPPLEDAMGAMSGSAAEPQPPRVLIVDESRLARAMLIAHLRERYHFREEEDGGGAWQALVRDHRIEAVLCSLSLPANGLDADGLLVRLRASRLERLARMPVLMIAGDDEIAVERARGHGASAFIGRDAPGAKLLETIDALLRAAQTPGVAPEASGEPAHDPDTRFLNRKANEMQAAQAMSDVLRHGGEVSALALAFDDFEALIATYGEAAVKPIQQRFARMLAGKVRPEDRLGHCGAGRFVVVSPGIPSTACVAFAERLRRAIYAAHIAIHGRRLQLAVSAGVANSPADAVISAGALIDLANYRLDAAREAGGNRIESKLAAPVAATLEAPDSSDVPDTSDVPDSPDSPDSPEPGVGSQENPETSPPPPEFSPTPPGNPEAPPAPPAPDLEHALALIAAGREKELLPHLAILGRQVMPLLALLDRRFQLDLPLACIEVALDDGVEDEGQEAED